jgi:hypothetical protein
MGIFRGGMGTFRLPPTTPPIQRCKKREVLAMNLSEDILSLSDTAVKIAHTLRRFYYTKSSQS